MSLYDFFYTYYTQRRKHIRKRHLAGAASPGCRFFGCGDTVLCDNFCHTPTKIVTWPLLAQSAESCRMGVLDYLRFRPQRVTPTSPRRAAQPGEASAAGDALDYLAGRTPAEKKGAHADAARSAAPRYDARGVWMAPEGKRVTPKRAETILRHYTGNGEELLVWMLLLARGEIGEPRRFVFDDGRPDEIRFDGPPPSLQLMADAAKWCADRVFGKAPETIVQITKSMDAEPVDLQSPLDGAAEGARRNPARTGAFEPRDVTPVKSVKQEDETP